MKILLPLFALAVLFCACEQKIPATFIAGEDTKAETPGEDSIAFRKANIEKWHEELQANYDSVVSFAFYMQKDYLDLKKKLDKYEKFSEGEKLVDELNNNMFSGGDPDHNPSGFFNLGEVGHFFKETKKELEEKKINYHWDTVKVRYALDK